MPTKGRSYLCYLSDAGKTGTSTAEDDGYDGFGRRHRAIISERRIATHLVPLGAMVFKYSGALAKIR